MQKIEQTKIYLCNEVVLLWQKVAQGSTPGYTCCISLNTVKAKIKMLWKGYRTTLPDIEFRSCEINLKFVQDQRTRRKSTFGNRDTKLLARLERKKIRKNSEKRRQDQAQVEKETLTMVAEESDGSFRDDETDENFCEPPIQRKSSEQILLRVPRNI